MSWQRVLEPYVVHPENAANLAGGDVLYYNDDVVLIQDKYPKARVHWLLLPRNLEITSLNPINAYKFDYPEEYEKLKPYVEKFTQKAAQELALYSKTRDAPHDFIKAGFHAVPSCSNIHVHIISKDFYSQSLKNAKHYLSFNSEFFVPFDDIPRIKEHDPRLDQPRMERLLKKSSLVSVWTGEDFARSFARLKKHLAEQYAKRFNETKTTNTKRRRSSDDETTDSKAVLMETLKGEHS